MHVASWRESYSGILPRHFLDDLSISLRAEFWSGELSESPAELIVHLARLDPGEAVGFCAVGPERDHLDGYEGEMYALYLLAEHQGAGVGKKLFLSGAKSLAERGYNSMALWVLEENPTRSFYEHLGGLQIGEQLIEIAHGRYREVACG